MKWEADVSMAGCQRSRTLSREGEREGKEKKEEEKKIIHSGDLDART